MQSLPWTLWAFLSAIFAALTAIFGKVGVADIPSSFATLLRTVVILVMIAGVVVASGSWQPLGSVSGRNYTFLVLSGLAGGASWLCYYQALKIGPASGVAALDKTSVVMVATFAALLLGEHLGPRGWAGIGLVALGSVLVATA